MREILFRGVENDREEWAYGYLIYDSVCNSTVPYIGYLSHEQADTENRDVVPVIPETVGQFTGLTDKNGEKIFEGDILKIVHKYQPPFDDDTKEYTDINTDVVSFDDEGVCFSYGKSPFLCVVDNVTAEYEVVGNIHDDPELLEAYK